MSPLVNGTNRLSLLTHNPLHSRYTSVQTVDEQCVLCSDVMKQSKQLLKT